MVRWIDGKLCLYILGLVSLLADAIGIEQFQHVQEKIAEVIVALETRKALGRTAEVDRRRTASASSRRRGLL
jgi:aromatic ring hydroxylase